MFLSPNVIKHFQIVGDNTAKEYFTIDDNGVVSVQRSLLTDSLDRTVYNVSVTRVST